MTLAYKIRSKGEPKSSSKHWKPHEYQVLGMEFLLKNAGAGLFLDPGLGKTSTTLGALRLLFKEKQIRRVLIVAPLRVCHLVWPLEVEKWEEFKHLRVSVLHGKDKEKNLSRDADIYVINPEGLNWLMSQGRFKKLGADVLVIDESSKFKHSNTARYKTLKPVLAKFKRRWILTGTPAPNGLLDLFGQVFIMDLGRALGPYITHYRAMYFSPGSTIERTTINANGQEIVKKVAVGWTLNPGCDTLIYEKLAPYIMRLDAKDYIKVPKIVEVDIEVELPPTAMKLYTQVEEDMVAMIDGNTVTAVSAASASVKCRQIASGGLYKQYEVEEIDRPKNREVIHIHDEKTEALLDLIDELQGAPLLIAYEFEHDLQRLRKALGKDLPVIGGGTPSAVADRIVKDWNAGKIPVMAGHPMSMGHGLNMQEAGRHVAWYTLTWNAELYDQFNKRVARQGNTHESVMVYRFLAKHTVDRAVAVALRVKTRVQNALLDALRDYTKERQA